MLGKLEASGVEQLRLPQSVDLVLQLSVRYCLQGLRLIRLLLLALLLPSSFSLQGILQTVLCSQF